MRPLLEEAENIRAFLQEERIAAGARLLDVPCGIGRRATGLAEAGYEVVAVDPNEIAIAAAKGRVPPAIGDRLTFASAPRETLPGLPSHATFEAVLCLDHALGRGPGSDDVAFLRRLSKHIRPDGLLVVDLLNRDFFASRRHPFAFHTIGAVEQHQFRSFDPTTRGLRLEWKFYERVGAALKHRPASPAEPTLLTARDLAAVLDQSGWKMNALWSGWRREPLSADHRKLMVTARPARTSP